MGIKTGIIGSGIGGIATAIRLALMGHSVTVFEKNSYPGGKLAEYKSKGYRFDMGPSLFTMPHFVTELFILAGKNPANYLEYDKLEILCKYHYEDGSIINAYQDIDLFAEEIELKTNDSRESILKHLDKAEKIYNLTSNIFILRALHKTSNLYNRDYLKAFLKFGSIDALTSMHNKNKKAFRDPRTQQLFDRYATYVGSNPYSVPATLNMISHLEHNEGAYFPKNGMYSIITGLHQLAGELNVKFNFNSNVDAIVLKGKKAQGLKSGGKTFPFDFIVSDIDVNTIYGNLLPGKELKPKTKNLSSSALVFYWGINKAFPELSLHNILFSNNYKSEFDAIFNKQNVFSDPTVYIFISSKLVKGDAPAGYENWFTMINVPPDTGQDWNALVKASRENIIGKINRMLKTDIENHITTEKVLHPPEIYNKTGSYKGSLYGINSNSRFAAFNRHPNHRSRYSNLYFVGGSVHPGGGIPMCLSSARIVAHEIKHRK